PRPRSRGETAGPRARHFFWRATAGPFGTQRVFSGNGKSRESSTPSHEQLLALHVLVEVGNIFAVAVEELRRDHVIGADDPLARLAPARMRHLRVHIGPEPVFAGLE